MKSKLKKHVFGYDVFEQDVPFSKLEEGDVLLTRENDAKRNHNWSFIKMNDDYIELIDQSYARLGKGISPLVLMSPILLFIFYIYISLLMMVIVYLYHFQYLLSHVDCHFFLYVSMPFLVLILSTTINNPFVNRFFLTEKQVKFSFISMTKNI